MDIYLSDQTHTLIRYYNGIDVDNIETRGFVKVEKDGRLTVRYEQSCTPALKQKIFELLKSFKDTL